MSFQELDVIANFFERARCPEDIFGKLDGTNKKELEDSLKHSHRKLAKVLHPDVHAGDKAARSLAEFLFQELEAFKAGALERIKDGTYGARTPLPNKMPVIIKNKYVRESSLIAGDIADLHIVSLESSKNRGNLLLKIARQPKDNDLLKAEAEALHTIHAHKRFAASAVGDAIPSVVESFLLDDNKRRLRANVLKRYEGFYSAESIRQKITIGVDGRTIAWMWKRLLVLLEWVHKMGFLHGAVLPPHVLFYPDNDGNTTKIDTRKHSLRLVDWCYTIEFANRTRLSAWSPAWKDFYAPEIIEKKKLGPWTDLYMGAKTMLYLAGGDPANNGFPDSIAKELVTSISKCLHKTPGKRPQDVDAYFEEFREAVRKAYGANRWHDFVVPGI